MKRALIAAGLIVAFVVGIAVGQSLDDGSKPGGTQTLVRTLQPAAAGPGGPRNRHGYGFESINTV